MAYTERKRAKKVIRIMREKAMRPYRCDALTDRWWHVGHLPHAVRRGAATRDEVYGGESS